MSFPTEAVDNTTIFVVLLDLMGPKKYSGYRLRDSLGSSSKEVMWGYHSDQGRVHAVTLKEDLKVQNCESYSEI